MIKSFKCKNTEKLYKTGENIKFKAVERAALRKLDMICAATTVETLRCPPANRLEQLKGDREGQYSVRINNKWRICFR